MKNHLLTLFVCVIALTTVSYGQEVARTQMVKPAVEIDLFLGGGQAFEPAVPDNLWQKYFPDFAVPTQQDGYSESHFGNYASPVMLMSFRKSYKNGFLETARIRSSFGLTVGTGSGYSITQQWNRSTSVTIDSFTVAGSNTTYPIDSVSDVWISRSIRSQDVMIGICQRFQTNPDRRFSFHFGVDVLYGFGINSSVSEYNSVYTHYTPQVGEYEQGTGSQTLSGKKTFSGPKFSSFNAQLPLEVTIRPFMRKERWKALNIGAGIRPTVRWYSMDSEKGSLFLTWYGLIFRLSL